MTFEIYVLGGLIAWFVCGAVFILIGAARSGFHPRSLRELPPPAGVIRKIGPNGGSRRKR
jgi:hypothetical protein